MTEVLNDQSCNIYNSHIGRLQFPLRWYGVIVMIGVIVGSLVVERESTARRKGDRIWDALDLGIYPPESLAPAYGML